MQRKQSAGSCRLCEIRITPLFEQNIAALQTNIYIFVNNSFFQEIGDIFHHIDSFSICPHVAICSHLWYYFLYILYRVMPGRCGPFH